MLACCLGYIFYGLFNHLRRKPVPEAPASESKSPVQPRDYSDSNPPL